MSRRGTGKHTLLLRGAGSAGKDRRKEAVLTSSLGAVRAPPRSQWPHPHPDPSAHHLHAGSPQQHSSFPKLLKFRPPSQRLLLEPRELWSFHPAERLYASSCHSSFCSRKTRGRSYSQAILGLKDVKPEQVPLASGFVFFKLGFSNRSFFFN